MKKPKLGNTAFQTINYLVFGIIGLACFYPFYHILIYSLSDPDKAATGIYLLPAGFTLQNYSAALSLPNILHATLISASRSILGTLITVFCSSLYAYIVTKKELYARKFVYRFLVSTMYLNAGLIPWYIVMRGLGLRNNYLLYILPGAVVAYFVVLVKTYIEQIPPSLEESAMIDGAGIFTVFIRIIVPTCTPILATITVFSAVGQWNNWTDNFFLANTNQLQTLQYLLLTYLYQAEQYVQTLLHDPASRFANTGFHLTPDTVRMTITMIVVVPIVLVYPFLQRYFVKGIMLGAVKG